MEEVPDYQLYRAEVDLEFSYLGRRRLGAFVMDIVLNGVPERLEMHPRNTKIKTFGEGDGIYDHVEIMCDDGSPMAIASQELSDLLFENDFPYEYDPLPDYATYKWAEKMAALALVQETSKFIYDKEEEK